MSFYIGIDRGWYIVSEHQFFAFDKKESKFIAIDSREEVLRCYQADGLYDVYMWDHRFGAKLISWP